MHWHTVCYLIYHINHLVNQQLSSVTICHSVSHYLHTYRPVQSSHLQRCVLSQTCTVFMSPSRNVCSGCRKSLVADAMNSRRASPSFCCSSPHCTSLLPVNTHTQTQTHTDTQRQSHRPTLVLLRLRQSLLRSITIDLSKKNRDVDVDSMSHGHVD